MVKLPYINTGARTLCQDHRVNPSSFWQSVAHKDMGEVHRHPEYTLRPGGSISSADIRSWTYMHDHNPRTKSYNWDWHPELPVDKARYKRLSIQGSVSSGVAPAGVASHARDAEVDYVKDYTNATDYAAAFGESGHHNNNNDVRPGMSDNPHTSSDLRFNGHRYSDERPSISNRDAYNRNSLHNEVGLYNDTHYRHKTTSHSDYKDPHPIRNRLEEKYQHEVIDRSDISKQRDVRERYDTTDYRDVRKNNDVAAENTYRTRDGEAKDQCDVRGKYDVTEHHRNTEHNIASNPDQYDNTGYGGSYNENGGAQQGGVSKQAYNDTYNNSKNEERRLSSHERRSQETYRNPNTNRYVSETMSKYAFRDTPRQENNMQPSREAALGIVPANEFYKVEPFERILPNCDRDETFRMATFPAYSFGKRKNLAETRKDEEDIIKVDHTPQDYQVNDTFVSRRKYIHGPRDSLTVPGLPLMWGFDGGAQSLGYKQDVKRLAQMISHPSNRTEIKLE